MDMLTVALGVEKPSIYANFGSKKDLYLEALAHYQTILMAKVSEDLRSGTTAREGIERLMRNLMAHDNSEIRRGCMATNSALEMADLDPDIRARIKAAFDELLSMLTQAIRRGQQEGDIRKDRPAGALAQFIVSCFGGARVLEKTSAEASHWPETLQLALSVLDPVVRATAGASTSKGTRASSRKSRSIR